MKTMILKDRTQIELTDDEAESFENALVSGKAEFIRIKGELYSPKSVDRIIKSRKTEVDVDPWATEESMLPQGKKCTGQHSIQNEINQIAKNDHPNDWARLIRDKDWREETRQTLLKLNDQWCDYKANTCVCD